MQAQGRTGHNHRTTGVVDPLAQQILAEPSLLALDHIGQGLQGTLVGSGDGATASTVIQQGIHRFLEHAFFVAHNNVRRIEVQQSLQSVVTVNHPTIQVVQVRSSETTTIQGYQGPQVWRQHRQYIQDHPLRVITGIGEGFQQLQPLGQLLDLGLGIGRGDFLADALDFLVDVDLGHQVLYRLGTHLGGELVAELFHGFVVLLIVQQLALVQGSQAGIGHHIGFKIQNALDIPQGHIQQQADTRGQ